MKKQLIYAMLNAIVLTGAGMSASCSSTEEETNVNPGYDPVKGEVPVQFGLSIALGNTPSTRQTADAVQATDDNTFRGIQDAHIMTFNQVGKAGQFLVSPTEAARDFDMAQVAGAATIAKDQSRRVLEMTLPLKTNTMVFYGRANQKADKASYGHLDDTDGYVVSKDLSNTSFHLGKRLSDENKHKFEQMQKLLAGILTCIMNVDRGTATVGAEDVPGTGIPKYGFAVPTDNRTWSDFVRTDGKSPVDGSSQITPLEEKLANVYKEMTTIQDDELRNGSSAALKSTIKNLWSIVNSVRCATPTRDLEAYAKYMAQRIHEELLKYFDATVQPDGGSVSGVGIRSEKTVDGDIVILDNFIADLYWPTTAGTKPKKEEFEDIRSALTDDELSNFPEAYDLPQGATYIRFDKDSIKFSYVTDYNTSVMGGAKTVDDYYFPPELLYFGNSPIRVSSEEHVASTYPQKTSAWDTDASEKEGDAWYGWKYPGEVESSTRSVAMRNDINYGTALLQTTVGYTTEVTNGTKKLKDNNAAIQLRDKGVEESDNEIVPTDASFVLKGVIVGGQSPRVGWNFLPALKTDASNPSKDEQQGNVYDSMIDNGGAIPVSGSKPNYTLVFDNYNKGASSQDRVYIALELMNNTGIDFMGKDNMIADQSNFYLIGELDPTNTSLDIELPTYHALPPYKADEAAMDKVKRVFIQDYMTTANFKIGEHSLKYAYLTVPDLRSSSVTLGLSVDVTWSTGLNFGDVILGGTGSGTTGGN